jgi:hypothetical protein
MTDSSKEMPSSWNDEADMIEAGDKFVDLVAARRPAGDNFCDVCRPFFLLVFW